MKISAHVLLKNEERFSWYSIISVIDFVDEMSIWDTGSSDRTLEIIGETEKTESAKKLKKFEFRKLNSKKFDEAEIRQEMLKNSNTDWIIFVDADEIWWKESIKSVVDAIRSRGEVIESIVVPTYNLVGDMFHYQEEKAGRYNLAGRVGHYNLRAMNTKIPGLHGKGEYGIFGWYDDRDMNIGERNSKKILFLEAPYLHATNLRRSSSYGVYKRSKKMKYEIGIEFPKDFYYPEVFFRPRPRIVPSVWEPMSFSYKFRAFFETPLRRIYRRTFLPFKKHGY